MLLNLHALAIFVCQQRRAIEFSNALYDYINLDCVFFVYRKKSNDLWMMLVSSSWHNVGCSWNGISCYLSTQRIGKKLPCLLNIPKCDLWQFTALEADICGIHVLVACRLSFANTQLFCTLKASPS